MPKICCTQQLDKGSDRDREEKERLRDLDNNVPKLSIPFLKLEKQKLLVASPLHS
jgi:hypothetical protein